jgi:hypothetical protein
MLTLIRDSACELESAWMQSKIPDDLKRLIGDFATEISRIEGEEGLAFVLHLPSEAYRRTDRADEIVRRIYQLRDVLDIEHIVVKSAVHWDISWSRL